MSQYKTGTVTVTSGSAAIVGTGTSWLANVTAGSVFSLIGSGVPYVVGTVVDDTHITLASNYAAANAANTSYALTTSYTPNLGIPYIEQGDVDTATIFKRAMLKIDQSVTGPAPTINATSTSNVAIGTGNKTFAIQTGKQFAPPQYLIAANAANSSQYLAGQVVSYNVNDGTLILNSTTTNGSGNTANWAISLSGIVGGTGTAATISVGNTTTTAAGSNAGVTNSGNSSAAVLNFNIPGGLAATLSVGNVTTLAPGSNATVTNTGNTTIAVFDFGLPAGHDGAGGGTVTSIGLSMPSLFSVANSPVTTTGTIAVTLATQNANTIFAGPSSGNAATPTFRVLAAADQGNLFNANGATVAIGGAVTFSGAFTTQFNVTGNSNITLPTSGIVATQTLTQGSHSANYTTVLSDANKHLLHPSADTTARVFTIDSNANVAYDVGATITFVNQHSAGNLSIAINVDTMRLAGAGTTGTRTLTADGLATALKLTSTEWIISGVNLT